MPLRCARALFFGLHCTLADWRKDAAARHTAKAKAGAVTATSGPAAEDAGKQTLEVLEISYRHVVYSLGSGSLLLN